MTFKRDKRSDIKITNELIFIGKKQTSDPSWLGHTKDCGIIDNELIIGATKEELAKRSGRELSGVVGHIAHLKSEHGLSISKNDGIFKLEYFHPKLNKIYLQEELQSLMEEKIDFTCENCIVLLEDSNKISKWYSLGMKSPKYRDEEVKHLTIEKRFAQSVLNKKVDEFVDFGAGYTIKSIRKFLS